MLVLGIETSCDETAAAVLKDGAQLLSNVIFDQIQIHNQYGGVVPELAGRSHIERIHLVINQSLEEAGVTLKEIDLIAVTQGPGLVGALLVGLNTAKGIAYAAQKPLVGVNHLEGHLLAVFLETQIPFPFLALGVSGGHTDLYRVDGFGKYKLLGRTRDDAAGECFDKVAKMMNLGYPGGPIIEKIARSGNPKAFKFPRALLESGSLDFSFSGLKTAVRNLLEKRKRGEESQLTDADVAASFQEAVVDVLVKKILLACQQNDLQRVVVTGGVAANGALREAVKAAAGKLGIEAFSPKPVNCTDNAAMIACAGYHRYVNCDQPQNGSLHLDARATLPL
ncbi:MAG: tRNA (adenosine(37)-N6)-threonylcarbamoyltransferase complex transferase subunit TsaD [Nitrospinaceae bacterium]|nr:MAG: tRNA (adenosine(37)-N6)-threonylcarbamoyltransferase complex transferase subunit TsaD [Nitrospinaceae bacterium]